MRREAAAAALVRLADRSLAAGEQNSASKVYADIFHSNLPLTVRAAALRGRAAEAVRRWITVSGITEGPLFRATDRSGWKVKANGISGRDVERIIRKRAGMAGLAPEDYGGHSLRSGFITEAGRRGIPPGAAMALSGHRSTRVFNGYYQSGDLLTNPVGAMLGA